MTDLYRPLRDEFAWHVPRFINIAERCCLQWADDHSHAKSVAIEIIGPDGHAQRASFQELASISSKIANGLTRMGAKPGDRVAVIMRDRVEALAVMLGCWMRQCIVVPLATTEHGDVLTQRVKQSRCRIVFTDDSEPEKVFSALQRCSRVQQIVGLHVHAENAMSWSGLLSRQSDTYSIEATRAQQPALLSWPQRTSTAYPPQTAYLVAHQALIGNLTGFVAANNWFPKNATGLQSSVSMLSELGMFGVILPSLSFGIGVRLQPTLPHSVDALSQGALKISHINTSSGMLCQWLRRTPDFAEFALQGVSVFGERLNEFWRGIAHRRFGVPPNLCTFVHGCGLLWGDSHTMWPTDASKAGRVFPGHRLCAVTTASSQAGSDVPNELLVSRTDPVGDPDPAVYVGIWPLKDPADVHEPIDMAAKHPCGVIGTLHDDGSVSIAGSPEDALLINGERVHPLAIEQAVMSVSEVMMAAAIHLPSRKSDPDPSEIWIVVELDGATSFSAAQRSGLRNRILESVRDIIGSTRVRIGISQRISIDTGGHPRRDLLRLRHGLSGVQPLQS